MHEIRPPSLFNIGCRCLRAHHAIRRPIQRDAVFVYGLDMRVIHQAERHPGHKAGGEDIAAPGRQIVPALIDVFGPCPESLHLLIGQRAAFVVQRHLSAEDLPPVVAERLGEGITQHRAVNAIGIGPFGLRLLAHDVSATSTPHGLSPAHKVEAWA